MDLLPSCSYTTQDELEELKTIGVNVWGQEQAVLEKQAFDELTTFTNYEKPNDKLLQIENETEDAEKLNKNSNRSDSATTLDINSYLKRQDELKRRQEYERSLVVFDQSKLLADQINNKQIGVKSANKARDKNKKRDTLSSRRKRSCNEINGEVISAEYYEHSTKNNDAKKDVSDESGSEYFPSGEDSDYDPGCSEKIDGKMAKKIKVITKQLKAKYDKVTDDGNIKCYEERLNQYYQKLENDKQAMETEVLIGNMLKSSSSIWNSLYQYQREGVQWLWNIHQKSLGGLLGDEMGLGKTVQIIAFLYSLNYTKHISSYGGFKGLGPTLIVSPSTVIHQWVKHFHDWTPEFRVSILHQSGSYTGNKRNLIKENINCKGILITTYQSMLKYKHLLTEQNWHYIVLDEGHKIRNPAAKISEAVKLFKTPHKLLLTGSPMQNNLQELWSLFDFVNPGMLGTLQVFMEHFATPIMQGGYMNATPMQEALALSMATALKDMISPHLLRRAKCDVKNDINLPSKSEQVLFCSITPEQRDLYRGYLMSDHIRNILGRGSKNWFSENYTRSNVLMSITTLRKICNHPNIYLDEVDDSDDDTNRINEGYGYYKRSGKMVVVAALLKMWKKQSHRVLLFTQSRAMISMFERFLTANEYKYLKMDGGTSVVSRQPLINKFNNDKSFDVFLLTTKVGGLGVNLTGADRVIIYDPDWNPATDTQARERAWRIGQDKEVTIYRLISAGTIEEKMYQRQIWKQLLSNKVLMDPKTQRFFKSSDLHDLFSLPEQPGSNPETTNIFRNSRISMEERLKAKTRKRRKLPEVTFTDDKVAKMKQLAAQIAKNVSKTANGANSDANEVRLDPMQKDLMEERQAKLTERAHLKKLTPVELLQHNREKRIPKEETLNQLDDCDTDVNFTKALIISEKAADLYKSARQNSKRIEVVTEEYRTLTEAFAKPRKRRKIGRVDEFSDKVEGEQIEGVIKRQSQKFQKKQKPVQNVQQDNYVLSKLFSKKGVQSALEHDNVVRCAPSEATSIKVHSETQMRTDLALQALRKSRIANWKW